MKVVGPLLSIRAGGWLGRWTYGFRGIVKTPYPIALLGKIHIPYRMPAWGLRPYPPFISAYYSAIGWTYQTRRTWHGIISVAERPPIGPNPRTWLQQQNRYIFASGVHTWQGFSAATKNIYHLLRYPRYASGYNRFLRLFMLTYPVEHILTEAEEFLTTEDGVRLIA